MGYVRRLQQGAEIEPGPLMFDSKLRMARSQKAADGEPGDEEEGGAVKLGCIAIMVVMLITCASPHQPASTELSAASVAVPAIGYVDLLSAYEANEVSADQQFKGKRIKVMGIVSGISKDFLGNPYITMGRSIPMVQCMFPRSDEPYLATVKKDAVATPTCTVAGKLMNVILKDCAP